MNVSEIHKYFGNIYGVTPRRPGILKIWPIFLKKHVRTAVLQTQPFMFPTVLASKSLKNHKARIWGG